MTLQNNSTHKGAALSIAVMVTALTLAVAVGASSLFFGQVRMTRTMGDSVAAFFAADAGAEAILRAIASDCATVPRIAECVKSKALSLGVITLGNGATYTLSVEGGGEGECPAQKTYCVKSLGTYNNARRAIRIAR